MNSQFSADNLSVSSNPSSHAESLDISPAVAVGLSNPQLSQGRRQMLDLVNRLHNTGVQVDLDLPLIAVIGSQSAGKSSLIESISGITLPRAGGTCTRCPTECKLSRSSLPWKCTVSLRRTPADGNVINEPFGDPIFEDTKSTVEDRIRRAQLAILNPSLHAEVFLIADTVMIAAQGDSELSFSKDCVSLAISGPEVADLSFCDLPGLIASTGEGGQKGDIKLIRSFVETYIRKPSCIILLTVACETDFQNQGAHELARTYDPDGKRTIGVLTKPDKIEMGDEVPWLSLIRNEKETLENNWFCVKQPGPQALKDGITWTEARKLENVFFSSTRVWAVLEPIYQKYLRTCNLVEKLSCVLSDLILKRLPEIQRELDASIADTRLYLNTFPKEVSQDPQTEISMLIHRFVSGLEEHIEGIPNQHGIIQTIRPAYECFKLAIRRTAPEFLPFERSICESKSLRKAHFLALEDGTDITLPDQKSNIISIDEVLERAQHARTRELPGNYPFVVQLSFIQEITKKWFEPTQALCTAVYNILMSHIRELVISHFGGFGQGRLEKRIIVLLQSHIRSCMKTTEERVNWLLALEARPSSLNTHYLSDYKEKFYAYYKGERQRDKKPDLISGIQGINSKKSHENEKVTTALSSLAALGMNGLKASDLAKLLPSDPMEPAIAIMAEVRAYIQVAYKRFVDCIQLAVDYELVCGIARDLLPMLLAGLGINGFDGAKICAEFAQEDGNIANLRDELKKKLERLNDANRELLEVAL